MNRIGIMGGAFNPIHNSHLYLAGRAGVNLGLDEVLFIPTYISPHKQAVDLASPGDRLAMCNIALEDYPMFTICDYEIRQRGISYTADTLEYLHIQNPKVDFWLIMGADMLLTLKEWRYTDKIFRLAGIAAAARSVGEHEQICAHRPSLEAMGARCEVLDIPPQEMSSTLIRGLIQTGGDASAYLPPGVWQYIQEHRLYIHGGGQL